jgi:peptidoglycan-associated lipoprotein
MGSGLSVAPRGVGRYPLLLGALLFAAVLALLLGGCSSTDETTEDLYGADGSKLSESDLQGGSGSSLDQYRRGTLGDSQGPLDDVYFDYDSADLSMDAREILNLNSEWLRANPSAKIEIEGHTDSRGTVEYNLGLGARRANSVRDYLLTLGISGERMTTISYGKELPLCQEESEGCWQRNRRAHLAVLS